MRGDQEGIQKGRSQRMEQGKGIKQKRNAEQRTENEGSHPRMNSWGGGEGRTRVNQRSGEEVIRGT